MFPSVPVRRAATAAAILAAIFPITVIALNLAQLGHYNPAADAVSLLALGRGGLALNMAFIAGGAATFTGAWVLRNSVTGAVAGPLLLTFFGCTSVISGLVNATPDNAPATTASLIHQLAGVLGFLAVIVAMFVFARRFAKDPAWHRHARPTLVWALAAAVTFVAVPAAPPALFGVAQYAHITTWLSWMIVTMIYARSLSARPAPSSPALTPTPTGQRQA
jgi:Protein of unknown function (DUF998)